MRSIIREIRQQPSHIREIFMWVMVVITFGAFGFIGFRSTEQKLVALLDPNTTVERGVISNTSVARKKEDPSPFALISDAFKGLSKDLQGLFSSDEQGPVIRNTIDPIPPYQLPVE